MRCASVRQTGLHESGAPLRPSAHSIVQQMALYVIVKRFGRWWIAAGQNTPVTGQVPLATEEISVCPA